MDATMDCAAACSTILVQENPVCPGVAVGFAQLLEQLRHSHYAEVEKLQANVELLHAELAELRASASVSPIFVGPDTYRSSSDIITASINTSTSYKSNKSNTSKVQGSHLKILKEQESRRMSTIKVRRTWQMCEHIAKHHGFEVFYGFIIFANAIIMACEMQYDGIQTGHDLGYRGCQTGKEEAWPGAGTLFKVLNWVFGLLYVMEFAIKIIGIRYEFVTDAWNLFDTLLVVIWIASKLIPGTVRFNANLLRLARLFRLLRMMRLVRMIESFDQLFLLTQSIAGSFKILAWSCALLFVILMMLALGMGQILGVYYFSNQEFALEDRKEIYMYFGSFTRALFSMFELTLANYPAIAWKLSEKVHQILMGYAVIHKLTMGFAIVGVINGVFMQETMKVAAADDRVSMMQKIRAKKVHAKKMRLLFLEADESEDGLLSYDEFIDIMSRDEVKTWLSSMEIDVSDADVLFRLTDLDSDGAITVDELISSFEKFKGTAKALDIHKLNREIKQLQSAIGMLSGATGTSRRQSRQDPDINNVMGSTINDLPALHEDLLIETSVSNRSASGPQTEMDGEAMAAKCHESSRTVLLL